MCIDRFAGLLVHVCSISPNRDTPKQQPHNPSKNSQPQHTASSMYPGSPVSHTPAHTPLPPKNNSNHPKPYRFLEHRFKAKNLIQPWYNMHMYSHMLNTSNAQKTNTVVRTQPIKAKLPRAPLTQHHSRTPSNPKAPKPQADPFPPPYPRTPTNPAYSPTHPSTHRQTH